MGYETGLYGQFEITPPVPDALRLQLHHASVWDWNDPPEDLPEDAPSHEYDSPFQITEDGTAITSPDDIGKFYSYEDWLPWLAERLIAAGHRLEGEITWDGDDVDDKGRFIADASGLHSEHLESVYVRDGERPILERFEHLQTAAEQAVTGFEILLAQGEGPAGTVARSMFVERLDALAAALAAARGILRGEGVTA